MAKTKITNIEVKKNNRNRIYRYICKCKTVSNPDISYALKLSLPTVMQNTKELLELGLTVHFNLVRESRLMPNKLVERCGKYLVLTTSMKIATPRQLFLKRLMDIAGSVVGLLLTGIAARCA